MTGIITMTSNAKAVSMGMRKLPQALKNAYFRGLSKIVRKGEITAKALAPQGRTGQLRDGIFRRLFKEKAELVSFVPTDFPYNFWVNAEPGFEVLNFTRYQPFFSFPQSVVYGAAATSSKNKAINWDKGGAGRGFFTRAFMEMDASIEALFTPEIEKALNTR